MEKTNPQETLIEVLNCDICLKEIPTESEEYLETDDYVRHFCGIECYTKWKEANKSSD